MLYKIRYKIQPTLRRFTVSCKKHTARYIMFTILTVCTCVCDNITCCDKMFTMLWLNPQLLTTANSVSHTNAHVFLYVWVLLFNSLSTDDLASLNVKYVCSVKMSLNDSSSIYQLMISPFLTLNMSALLKCVKITHHLFINWWSRQSQR